MRDRADVEVEQARGPTVLRVLLIVGGGALGVLAALSAVMAIEGARGPTPRLGQMGYIWEGIFIAATLVLTAGMLWISTALRAVAPWVLATAAGVALVAAAIVASARLAGVLEVVFPLANWVPATVLISLWGWAAGRAAVRQGRLPSAMGTAASALAVLQVVVLLLSIAVFAMNGGRNVALNIAAGLIVPAITAGTGAWWICLGALWRADRQGR